MYILTQKKKKLEMYILTQKIKVEICMYTQNP